MVNGTPSLTMFLVYTKGMAENIDGVRNGYLGWHYVNNIDTCVYASSPFSFATGMNAIMWNGKDNDGNIVPPGNYTYYLWGYDHVNPKTRMAQWVDIPAYHTKDFQELDEDGFPLPNPIYYNRTQRWVIGSDPDDPSLIETGNIALPEGFQKGDNLWMDPFDFDYVYQGVRNPDSGYDAITKWQWVPNGDAVLQTDFGAGGYCSWNSQCDVHSPVTVSDRTYIYTVEQGYHFSDGYSEFLVIDFTGDIVDRIDMTEWWSDPYGLEAGAQMNGGPDTHNIRHGKVFLNSHSSCLNQMVNPAAYLESGDPDDFYMWSNGNGDYVLDKNFEPDSPKPWVCNDFNVPPWKYNISPDDNLFSFVPCYDMGAVSFGMYAPDGTGLGYFAFAGETAGLKLSNNFIDSGTPYDGIYCDNNSAGGMGVVIWNTDETRGVWFVAHDSFKGTITSLENYISVTSPNGGERWKQGTQHDITWISNGVETVKIEYSSNGGTNWDIIAEGVSSSPYNWNVPLIESENCFVRITSENEPVMFDLSNSAFAIYAGSDFSPTVLTFTAPDILQYGFDGSTLEVPVMVEGTPASMIFLVYTKDMGQYINGVQNGYLGWHYVNKVDTCVYHSPAMQLNVGSHTINWDGTDQDGNLVMPGIYAYHLWGFDNVNFKIPITRQINPYPWARITLETHDEAGIPLSNPVLWSGSQDRGGGGSDNIELREHINKKWLIGNDPDDYALLETCLSFEVCDPGGLAFQPDDHDMFFKCGLDNTGYKELMKWQWVPNGTAVKQTDWGVNGEYKFSVSNPNQWEFGPGVVSDGDEYLLVTQGDLSGTTTQPELIYVDVSTGNEVKRFDLTDWWVSFDDQEAGGQANSGPTELSMWGNKVLMGSHASCVNMLFDVLYANEDDAVLWVNQNGDYTGDHNFEEYSVKPWVCNDYNVGPYKYNIAIEKNGFSFFPSYDMGAVSFGLYAPDGTGLGYHALAGETAGQKYDTSVISYDSAFDGLMVSNQSAEEDRVGWFWVGQDSFKGMIVPMGGAGWMVHLSATGGSYTVNLLFGTHPAATDGVDPILGEIELPPKPPAGAFDARFTGAELGNGVWKDLRGNEESSYEFVMDIQRVSSEDVTLVWDSLTDFEGVFLLQDAIDGSPINLNMKSTTQYTITNSAITLIKIKYYAGVWEMSYAEGWDMISLGLDLEDKSLLSVFPSAISLYGFDNGYQQVTELEIGKGYWVNLDAGIYETDYSAEIDDLTLNLPEKWNMIGSISNPIAATDIVQDPPDNIISIYGYSGTNYVKVYPDGTGILEQGKGYWINMAAGGSINLNSASGTGKVLAVQQDRQELLRDCTEVPLTISTSRGQNTLSLYVTDQSIDVHAINRTFEKPPVPPFGIFDARIAYENTNGLENLILPVRDDFETTIDMSLPDDNSVLVSWLNEGLPNNTFLLSDGTKTVDMAKIDHVELHGNTRRLTFLYKSGGDSTVPTEYSLMPNYPNPFNPATTIGYTVKSTGKVELTVYNMLGQEIKKIVDDIHESGKYNVQWDGKDEYGKEVSAGLYLYRLKVNEFTETKKMLFMK